MALFDNCTSAFKLADLSDATGNITDLTNNNSVTFVAGKIGNCGQFVSASSKYLSHASNATLNTGDIDWTIGCWVYLDTDSADMTIVGKEEDGVGLDYRFRFQSGTNRFQFLVTGLIGINSASSGVTTGQWYCVLGWHDAAADTISIQVDNGAPLFSGTGGPIGAPVGAVFRIGARATAGTENYWNGKIDAVHIWKRVLSAPERTEFYNSGVGIEYGMTATPQMPYYGGSHSPYRKIDEIVGY